MYKLYLTENKTATKIWLQRELKETMEGKEHYTIKKCKDYCKLSFPTATEGV